MAEIVLGRIDPRFVHGRVLPLWVEASGADSAVIVDDVLAEDDFMTTIYQKTGQRQNIPVACFSVAEFQEKYNADYFSNHKLMILLGNVESAVRVIEGGITFDTLNVGALVYKGEDYRQVTPSVAITQSELEALEEIEAKGVQIQICPMPGESEALSLKKVKEIFESDDV